MKKEDFVYYLAYMTLFILIGLWMVLWAVDVVTFGEAVLLWLISAGILMIALGTVKTRRKPKGETTLVTGGMLLAIIALITLALIEDTFNIWLAAGLAIIFIGLGGLGIFMSRIKGTIED